MWRKHGLRSLVLGLLSIVAVCSTERYVVAAELTDEVRRISPQVIDVAGQPDEDRQKIRHTLSHDTRARLRQANRDDLAAWKSIDSRQAWERFRDDRLAKLRLALGELPPPPAETKTRVTQTLAGPGYRIDNLLYESRSGLWVTGNLYRPAEPQPAMPAMLICPSHHNPKTQGELQDMGVTWARQGCLVLVIDNLGHGERRQHPFRTAGDFAGAFSLGRQDYFFRYNVGLQLQLIGESLLGWMAWDLMRGVDVLLQQPGTDPNKIVLLGSVAGGGDPAAVAAALDPRIACVVPFNFGGPQPETRYPLPEEAAETFDYLGSGSWESTRNPRLTARDGLAPWLIVGSVAPRRLIYAHEFSWDQPRDPVWQRLQTIFGYYDAVDNLAFTHGHGTLSGPPAEASHCNNIGPVHRQRIHAAFTHWFALPTPDDQAITRRSSSELLCLESPTPPEIRLEAVHALATTAADEQLAAFRATIEQAPLAERRSHLQQRWTAILGATIAWPRPQVAVTETIRRPDYLLERLVVTVERDIRLPALLLKPLVAPASLGPVVIGVAQAGKGAFLQQRAATIAALLKSNVTVCLVDVRGSGESSLGDDRGRRSEATSVSASQLMLGTPLLGEQLRDLRTVIRHLRQREDLGNGWFGLWGDSFAPAQPVDSDEAQWSVPLDVQPLPPGSEPAGPLLALLAALYESDVRAVALPRGGLISYRSVLASPFCYLPHDSLVPGVFSTGDIPELVSAATSDALLFHAAVDGLNRSLSTEAIESAMRPRPDALDEPYPRNRHPPPARPDNPPRISFANDTDITSDDGQVRLAAWLIAHLPGAAK